MAHFQLAQLNVARMLAPLEAPVMAGFVARLDEINQLADAAPGFIWRLQTEEGDATALRPFDADLLVNLTLWADLESLANFVYRSAHSELMRQRRSWFSQEPEATLVLWWIPSGDLPTLDQAAERLALLRRHGPTARAFTFRQPYAQDGTA
jgi:hypothetical protein